MSGQRRSTRITAHDAFMIMAIAASFRSTCPRRMVGCVLVSKTGHVLATGYNGSGPGEPNCIEQNCPGVYYTSGEGLDRCHAIHAEQNAIGRCANPADVHTAYCTTLPCINCIKQLKTTGCTKIVYVQSYPTAAESLRQWFMKPGADAEQLEPPKWNIVVSFFALLLLPSSSQWWSSEPMPAKKSIALLAEKLTLFMQDQLTALPSPTASPPTTQSDAAKPT